MIDGKYLTAGELRRMLAGVPDDYVVYIRIDDDMDGEVFLTNEMPKLQAGHCEWAQLKDGDFVRLYGFIE